MDEYSDVDLTLIVLNESFDQVMNERMKFAQQFDGFLKGFTGEHVGEPRLLIFSWPNKVSQWFEDRSWIWIHYGLTKVLRGELLEIISMLTFFRDQVFGPLISQKQQLLVSNEIQQLQLTISKQNDKESILQSLKQSINLYLNYRNDDPPNNLTENMQSLY
ncbi:hypothetical protein ACTFIY_009556 [Dictyostelium cf. discoideum]